MIRMAYVSRVYYLYGIMSIMAHSIRGMGYSTAPTAVSLIGTCGLRLVWVFTAFQIPAFHTQEALFLCFPVSFVVTFLAHLVCYLVIRRRLPKTDTPIPIQSAAK